MTIRNTNGCMPSPVDDDDDDGKFLSVTKFLCYLYFQIFINNKKKPRQEKVIKI